MNNDNSRAINILLGIAGVLCCIGSGFVPAPEGLLADESINLIQAMQLPHLLVFFALPSALMVLACILVIIGKMDVLSICSVLAGGALFAIMDCQFGMSYRTFSGILINGIGVIIMVAAVALQVFATESGPAKVSRKAAKSRNPKEFRYERSRRPAYDDIYMDIQGSAAGKKPEDSGAKMPEDGEYFALDALKAEEAEDAAAEKAQKEQEDEIEAMLAALSADTEPHETAKASVESTAANKTDTVSVEESLAELETELDAESEAILAELEAETKQAEEELNLSMPSVSSSVAMAHMAGALETPNKTMTDFYEGIEEIFLDPDNQ
ncbi:MAG: hypothetical protein IKK28_05725 [Mogibacterium sp.]|nr:hypothetical protein [Mogibacterium sp.]MBR4090359.1 hypothetical protein [Mogibacterium sp.]